MKVLLISDKPNWAYAAIANALIRFNTNRSIELYHKSIKTQRNYIEKNKKNFDLYFVLGWQNYIDCLDKKRTLIGVHSHQSFDNRKSTPSIDVKPDNKTIDFLSQFRGINAVSERLKKILESCGLNVSYTKNGVDTSLFVPNKEFGDRFIVGCVSSVKNDWNKGVESIIRPACDQLDIPLKTAMFDKQVSHEVMPNYYKNLDCYICASLSEGMSMSILEASSCGNCVISTNCGDITNLIQHDINGMIIDRDIKSLSNALLSLKNNIEKRKKISTNIRETIEKDWDWKIRINDWMEFIKGTASG